ncbi:MAG TPA: type II toxin-antitoxin system RelE/ParE family toxin [Phycisphaerae bacterium]|nr:type II toxin-antitoxin system RelE/ParE family toxin [Phycisphaerae bacterium]
MAEVIWSPEALRDLEDIAAFSARDSDHHAALFVQRLLDATDRLAEFPESGRVIPEIGGPRFREVIEGTTASCTRSPATRSTSTRSSTGPAASDPPDRWPAWLFQHGRLDRKL